MIARNDLTCHTNSRLDWAEEVMPFWEIEDRIVQTWEGYEGNGLGSALLGAMNSLIPAWVKYLGHPQEVITHHLDGARGREQPDDATTGYRALWTSNILISFGYSNNRGDLEYYLGENRVAGYGENAARHWIKKVR